MSRLPGLDGRARGCVGGVLSGEQSFEFSLGLRLLDDGRFDLGGCVEAVKPCSTVEQSSETIDGFQHEFGVISVVDDLLNFWLCNIQRLVLQLAIVINLW